MRINMDVVTVATHPCYLVQVTCLENRQDLDRNLASFMLAFPHVGVPATIQGSTHPIIAKRNLH